MVMADDDDDSDNLYIDERDPLSPENNQTDDLNTAIKKITTELRNIRKHSGELPPINYFPLMKNVDFKTIESEVKEEKPRITCKDFSRVPFGRTDSLLAGSNVVHHLADLEQFTDITMAGAEVNQNADGSIQLHVPETAPTIADNLMDPTGYSNMTQVKDPRIPQMYTINRNVMSHGEGATMNASRQTSVIVPNSASPLATVVVEPSIQRHDGFNTTSSPTSVHVVPFSSTLTMPTRLNANGSPPAYHPRLSTNLPTPSTSSYDLPPSTNNVLTASTSYGPPNAQRPDGFSSNLLTTSSTAYGLPSAQSLPTINSNYGPHYGHPETYPDVYKRQIYSHNSHAEYYGQAPASYNQRPYTNYSNGPYPTMGHSSNSQHHMPMSPCMACTSMSCCDPRLPPSNPGLQGVPMPPWNSYGQTYSRSGPPNATYKGRDIQDYLAEMRKQDYMLKRKRAKMHHTVSKPLIAATKKTYANISINSNTQVVVNSNPVINNPGVNLNDAMGHNIPNWEALMNGETKKQAKTSEVEPRGPPFYSLWPPNMTQVTRTNNITPVIDSTSTYIQKPTMNNKLINTNKIQKETNAEVHSTVNMTGVQERNCRMNSSDDISTTVTNVERTNNTLTTLVDSTPAWTQKPKTNKTPDNIQKAINAEAHSTMNMNISSSEDTTTMTIDVERINNSAGAIVDSTSACTQKPKLNNTPNQTQREINTEVHLPMNMNTSSSEDIKTMNNNDEGTNNTTAECVDLTPACTKKLLNNKTPDNTQKAINAEAYSTMNMNISSSGDITMTINVERINNSTVAIVDSTSARTQKPKMNNTSNKTQKEINTAVHLPMSMDTNSSEDITTMTSNIERPNNTIATHIPLTAACSKKPERNNIPDETQKAINAEVHSTMNINTSSSENIITLTNNVERPNNTIAAHILSTAACLKKPKTNNIPDKTQKAINTDHTIATRITSTAAGPEKPKTNNIPDKIHKAINKKVPSIMNMNTSSSEDKTTVTSNVQRLNNTIAALIDTTTAFPKKPKTNNISDKTQEAINTEVHLPMNLNISSPEDITTMTNNVERLNNTIATRITKTAACPEKLKTNNIPDRIQKAINTVVHATMKTYASSSEDITTMVNNVERTNNTIAALVGSTSACIQKSTMNNTSNNTQKEINTEAHSTMNTSGDITTANNVIAASDIETLLVVDLTDDTDSILPTDLELTTINKDDIQIPLILEQEAEIGKGATKAEVETVIKTVQDVAFVEPPPKVTDIPNVLTSSIANDKVQINVTPTLVQSNAYQVKMSTTSTSAEKYLHSVENNAVSRSDTLIETGFNRNDGISILDTVDHRIETKVTVEVFSQISVEYLKNILNTVSSVQTNVEDTMNDIDTTHGISQTNAVVHNETTVCQESDIVSEDHKLEIARKKLALLSKMEREIEYNSSKDVNKNVQTNTGSNYQKQISTEENGKYFGQVMISQERFQDNCSTGAINNELILHSERNQEIEVLSRNRCMVKDQQINVTSESGENICNNINRLTEPIIDETLFFKFQVNFFRLVQERLSENNCFELANELSKDIHNLIAISDDEGARADMKYKCHMCLNVAIYSPRSLYYKQANNLERFLAKIQSCPLCITFRKKYVEILMKYIEIEAKTTEAGTESVSDVQSHSTISLPGHAEEDNIAEDQDNRAKKQIDDHEIEKQLSLITNGVPSTPKKCKIDDQTSHNSNPPLMVNSTTDDSKNNNFVVKLPTNRLKESTVAALWKKLKSKMMKPNIGRDLKKEHDNSDNKIDIISTESTSNKHLEPQTTNAFTPCHNKDKNLKNQVSHDITQNNNVVAGSFSNTDTNTASIKNDLIIKNKEKHVVPTNNLINEPDHKIFKGVSLKIHLNPNPEHNRVILNDDNTDQEQNKNRILKKSTSHVIKTHKNRELQKRNSTSNSTDQEKHHKRRKNMYFEIASNKNTSEPHNIVDNGKNYEKQRKPNICSAESAHRSNSELHNKVANPTYIKNDKKQEKHSKVMKSINADTEPNRKPQNRNTNTDDIKKNPGTKKHVSPDIDSTNARSLNLDANGAPNNNMDTSITRKSSTNNDPASTEAFKDISSNSSRAENAEKVKTNNNFGNEKTNNDDARNDNRKETGDTEKDGRETTEENHTNNKRQIGENNDVKAEKSNEIVANALEDCSKTLKDKCTDEKELPKVKISGKRRKSKSKRDCVITEISYKYMCHICTVSFHYLQSCLGHMSDNHAIENPKIPSNCITRKCAFCPLYISNSSYNYNNHVKSAHREMYTHK